MLAGYLHSRRCHSPMIVQAQWRSAIPRVLHTHSFDATQIRFRFGLRYPNWPHSTPRIHLSTTAARLVGPRNFENRSLKPRSKPKFRAQRTEEKDKHVETARGARREEYTHSLDEAHDIYIDHVQANSAKQQEDAFVSPFFAVRDVHLSQFPNENELTSNLRETSNPTRTSSKVTRLSRDQASTADLERELYYLAHNDPHPTAIHNILKILIHDRQTKPEVRHYEALILANTWPEFGSAGNVGRIIVEMEAEGIEIGPNIIAAILKVLAIHPSPELSHEVLEMAERRWTPFAPQTRHHLILAMIRTGQTELAAWKLDGQRVWHNDVRPWDREVIPDYLVVLLIVQLVGMGDWEGVLRHFYKLRNRRAADREIPTKFWGWLLECASKAARATTEAKLQGGQTTKQLNPSDNVLVSRDTHGTSEPIDSTITNIAPSSRLPAHIKTQIELSNPALYLTQDLWSYYASVMSVRPSWSTCTDILHAAANAGIPWLAHNVLATMTYLDGIDPVTGTPLVTVPEDLRALAGLAEQRAAAAEQRKRDAESPAERERRAERQRAAEERERSDREVDAWWDDLMRKFDEEEGKDKKKAEDVTNTNAPTVETQDEAKQDEDIEEEEEVKSTSPPRSTYGIFDRDAVPAGNLWPLFPSIPGQRSTHIDPWDALGPRSSARRKWTEAQEYYKARDRLISKNNRNKK